MKKIILTENKLREMVVNAVKRAITESIDLQNIYTMEKWRNDRTLKVQEGQIIEPEVFYQLMGSVPPETYSNGIFQPGEPADHEFRTGRALYMTFEHVGNNFYKYVGLRPSPNNDKIG